MGYTTEFEGSFKLDKPLTEAHRAYLAAFAGSRRMKRDEFAAECLLDQVRAGACLPVGDEGGYYVGGAGSNFGQDHDGSIVDYNIPPRGQPGLWCGWVPNEAGDAIEWDGGEKFYDYVEWLRYLIEHFVGPWGYKLTGVVDWQGEEGSDFGRIDVDANVVRIYEGKRSYRRVKS